MVSRMTESRTKTRLYVDADLTTDGVVTLDADQARYLGGVLRMEAGDAVSLFNGRDGEWRARIESLRKGRGSLVLESRLREQADEPGPWLLFAPLKKSQTDFVVEKATELGARGLQPVLSAHTSTGRVNVDRLRANAREAAEQCGRLTVPDVSEAVSLEVALMDWPEGRTLLVMDETGGGESIAKVASRLDATQAAVLVGPEGGFSDEELSALAHRPFVVRVGLGPRILRAETAALAALSCLQAQAGDWGETPPERTSR